MVKRVSVNFIFSLEALCTVGCALAFHPVVSGLNLRVPEKFSENISQIQDHLIEFDCDLIGREKSLDYSSLF